MNAADRKGIVAPLPASYRTQDYDLANVTPEQVRSILRNVRTGKLEDQDRLFRMMVDSWSRLRKCINEIAGNVTALELEIKPGVREGMEEPTDQALQIYNVVERALESYAPRPSHWELDTNGMVKALIDAYAKGISVVEIIWHVQNGVVSPRCYAPIPAKYLAYPSASNEIDRLMMAPKGVNYETLQDFPPDKFLIAIWQQGGCHPIHSANLRALTKFWLSAIYGHGWFMQYAQLFGVPWRHAETDGSDEAMAKAQEMLENIGSSGWAVTGNGTKINILDGIKGGESLPQVALMHESDKACDILMLGQTLTTDVGDSGSRALGDVHATVRADILQGVATWISQIITTQLIPAIVRMNFGAGVASEDMPYAEIEIPKPKDEKAIAERVKIITKDVGLPVSNKWIYEELGIPEPQEGDALFGEEINNDLPPLIPDVVESARNDIDLRPTEDMAKAARDALEIRRQKPASERGMTAVGIARARDISNRSELSPDTVKRMVSFFARHEVDKKGETWGEKGKGWQAWHGWGGDAGREWASAKLKQLENDQ
jgi:phage gp29-like protein